MSALDRAEGDVRIGAATVHWRREGHGPALVLLHGFPLSGHAWQPVVALLRERFTCYTPDLIGLGGSSSTHEDDYSSQGQARALSAALDALGVTSFALVGNDTGGWVAREIAVLEPARVTHLVLTNTEIPGHRPPWIPIYQALANVPGFGAALSVLMRSRSFLHSPLAFGGCFHNGSRIDGEFRDCYVVPLLRPGTAVDGVVQFLRRMKFSRLDEFRRLHANLRMPTLFIWGEDDPTFPLPLARDMSRQFGNVAGFEAIPQARLLFFQEYPDAVASRMTAFIAG